MKKSLLALAILGAFTGIAAAQSNVTLFGVVDESVNRINNGGTTQTVLAANQLNSNRLGFKGTEDLGGGLSAGFWLEAGMDNGSGYAGGGSGNISNADAASGQLFNRRSTVSLMGTFGEIRMGRDYDPSFWNEVFGDVNGANGIGEGLNLVSSLGSGATTIARANNSVTYFLPGGLGGVYGEVMMAAGQGTPGVKYKGGRLGWGAGPADISVAYGDTQTAYSDDFKVMNIGGSYNFGVATIYAFYDQNKWGNAKQSVYELSAGVPIGPGQLRASYGHTTLSGTSDKGTMFSGNSATLYGVEYVYDLSKMTSVYASYGHISNTGPLAAFEVLGTAGNAANNTSTGYNAGLRVSF